MRWHALNSGADYFKNDDRLATVDPLTGTYQRGRGNDSRQLLDGGGTRWHALNSGAEYFKNDDRLATADPLTGR